MVMLLTTLITMVMLIIILSLTTLITTQHTAPHAESNISLQAHTRLNKCLHYMNILSFLLFPLVCKHIPRLNKFLDYMNILSSPLFLLITIQVPSNFKRHTTTQEKRKHYNATLKTKNICTSSFQRTHQTSSLHGTADQMYGRITISTRTSS